MTHWWWVRPRRTGSNPRCPRRPHSHAGGSCATGCAKRGPTMLNDSCAWDCATSICAGRCRGSSPGGTPPRFESTFSGGDPEGRLGHCDADGFGGGADDDLVSWTADAPSHLKQSSRWAHTPRGLHHPRPRICARRLARVVSLQPGRKRGVTESRSCPDLRNIARAWPRRAGVPSQSSIKDRRINE